MDSTIAITLQRSVVLGLATLPLLAACELGNPSNQATPSSILPATLDEGLKLGVLLPTTGDLAPIGQPMVAVLPLLVDQVNACGGVNQAPVTLIIKDTQTDPVAGVEAMTQLVEVNRVHGVVGAIASSVSSGAVEVAVRNRIPLLSPGSTSPIFTERAKQNDFRGYWARTAPPDRYQAAALAQLAIDRGYDRISTIAINNDYGIGLEQAFVATFEKLGGTVINRDNPSRYDPQATTFESEAAAVFSNSPDAVLAVLYPETGSLLLRSAYQQGLTNGVQILLTDGVKTETFPDDVGQTADGSYILSGAIGTVPGASGPGLEQLTALWEETQGTGISAFVPHAWDAGVLLILAAQAAGTHRGEAIMAELRSVAGGDGVEVSDVCEGLALLRDGQAINYQGASGNVDIDEYGDVVSNYDIWTVTDEGAIAVIDHIRLD
ncbi:MAG: amino acid ABC transporter substrate-binding protein [Leptolyngbya sp. DLM2.Bin15]|nr:MAG: amino acid ABC transporter substrate-binding protein [Leptolyngbya sp. DLM2.Bin15]